MKYLDWDEKKNKELIHERNISFEDILVAIEDGSLLDIIKHPNSKKYPNQKIFVVYVVDYVYLVPFAEDEKKVFLKTIIPSRKATKYYLNNKNHEQT